MQLLLFIVLLLPGLNYGFLMPGDTECKVITSATCTVTLGGNIFLQVINNASGSRIKISSGSKEMFTVKKGALMVNEDAFKDRTEVFKDNGTIKIENVQWEDARQYKVEIYNLQGTKQTTMQVTIDVKAHVWPIVVYAGASAGALLLVILTSCCIYKKVTTRKNKTAPGL